VHCYGATTASPVHRSRLLAVAMCVYWFYAAIYVFSHKFYSESDVISSKNEGNKTSY